MIPTLTTLLKTITGKVVIGLTVVTMGVGAAAAGGAELPMLTSASADDDSHEDSDDSHEDSDDSHEDSDDSHEDSDDSHEDSDDSHEDSDESGDDTRGESQAAGEDAEQVAPVDDGDDAENHGAVVSEFTTSTDLTGCEKGQATAAVARGDVDPSGLTEEELATELADYIAKCDRGDDLEHADDDDDADAEDTDEDWKDIRDGTKATWHEAKDAYELVCGDDDADDAASADGEDADDNDGDDDGEDGDDELSPACRAMKDDLKQLHEDGKAEWKDARDDAKAERKADRDEAKAERKSSKGSSGTAKGKHQDD